MNASLKLPRKLARYRGTQYWKFFVVARQSGVNRSYWEHAIEVPVIAPNPAEACRFIKLEIAAKVDHPTEVECAGPKGGVVSRFIGFESLIWARMDQVHSDWEQIMLL